MDVSGTCTEGLSVSRVLSMGEALVEIMRTKKDVPHDTLGEYSGPYPSGAPAIFIDAVARLGIRSGFIGAVGDDEFGSLVVSRLRNDRVDTSHLKIKQAYTTGTAFVMYYSSGARKFIYHLRHSAAGQLGPQDVSRGLVSKASLLHIMGSSLALSDSSRGACFKAMRFARGAKKMITFDPNLRPELLSVSAIRRLCRPVLEVSDVVMPSIGEAETLTGASDPVQAGQLLLRRGPRMAVIKLGEEGAVAVTKERVIRQPAFKVKEIDPTGAGDVFDGALVVALLSGWKLERALRFACAAGAVKVTRRGPMEGPASKEEVEEFIARGDQ